MMARPFSLLPLGLALALAACGGNAPRYLIDPPAAQLRLTTPARTIMLRDVSLPEYASASEIAVQEAGGAVRNARRALWADRPERAVTLALARQLDAALSATVAAEPWPLSGLPDAEIEVRVAHSLAGADNVFRLQGQYYVRADGMRHGMRLGPASAPFAISVPMQGTEPADIARAQSAAIAELAATIARGLGR